MDNILINTTSLSIPDIIIKLKATSRFIPFLEVHLINSTNIGIKIDNIAVNTIYLIITDIVIKLNASSRFIRFLEVPLMS